MSVKNKFALGALVGAMAGVIAGVLTAPKSGKETRTSIKDKASELKQKSVKKAKDTKGKAEELKVRGENAIEGAKKGFKTTK